MKLKLPDAAPWDNFVGSGHSPELLEQSRTNEHHIGSISGLAMFKTGSNVVLLLQMTNISAARNLNVVI
jgi:hypothetical protein